MENFTNMSRTLLTVKRVIFVLIIILLTTFMPARAEYYVTYTGADLLNLCIGNDLNGKPNARATVSCMVYIGGVMDLYGKLRTFDVISDERFIADFCIPEGGLPNEQLRRAVLGQLLLQNDARLSGESGGVFVLLALSERWPCQ